MTNSAKQTDRPQELPPARAVRPPGSIELMVWLFGGLGLLLVGWLMILAVHNWHLTSAVFLLCMGWASILGAARFMWVAAWTAAGEGDHGDEDFWKPVGRRTELLSEKKALIKAIKEIEFDHQMGKMSDRDAASVSHYYRERAIEVIKALESNLEDHQLPVREQIDREVRARLAVPGAATNARRPAVAPEAPGGGDA